MRLEDVAHDCVIARTATSLNWKKGDSTGCIYDPQSGKILYSWQSNRYYESAITKESIPENHCLPSIIWRWHWLSANFHVEQSEVVVHINKGT